MMSDSNRWVGEKLGIIEKDKHQDDEEDDDLKDDKGSQSPKNTRKEGYSPNPKSDGGFSTPKKSMPTVSPNTPTPKKSTF